MFLLSLLCQKLLCLLCQKLLLVISLLLSLSFPFQDCLCLFSFKLCFQIIQLIIFLQKFSVIDGFDVRYFSLVSLSLLRSISNCLLSFLSCVICSVLFLLKLNFGLSLFCSQPIYFFLYFSDIFAIKSWLCFHPVF